MITTLHFIRTMLIDLDSKRKSEEGATAVEYGLMVALIAVGIIAAVMLLEGALTNLFTEVASTL